MATPTNLHQLSAAELRQGYRDERFKVRDVAEVLLSRAAQFDPDLHAFLHLDAVAIRAQADALDANASARAAAPLFGVPVAIKDNISTCGQPTTCGSRILEKFVPIYDAGAIDGLRRQGALLFGKTNMDEFAMGSSTENSAYGPTRNPWDRTRVPGGSSGGSATAVAARLVPVALGSDTGGSVRQPAAFTGTLGLKCTYGLVSRYGLVAYASSLDQIGPIGRTPEDLAMVLGAIAHHDQRDSTSLPDPAGHEYLSACRQPVQGLRVGVPKEMFGEGIADGVRTRVMAAVEQLAKLGMTIKEISVPSLKHSLAAYYIVAPAEASSNLARFDGIRYGPRQSGTDLIDMVSRTRGAGFGREVRRRILLGTYVLSSGYYDAYYLKAMKVRRLITNELTAALTECDVLVSPTTPSPAFKLGELVNDPLAMYMADICTIAINLAGVPALSVPVAPLDGLPVGLQLIGPHFGERRLLAIARSLLDVTGHHQPTPAGLA